MATFVSHGPCPKCGSRDNFATYSDGSGWCFGCHHHTRATGLPRVSPSVSSSIGDLNVKLSDDLCNDFPRHVVEWLARYDVSVAEAISHGWKYSPYWDQLVFLFKDAEGRVAVSQARNFRQGSKKYFNQGSVAEVLPIFRAPNGQRRCVVVEDAVSAARIARQCDCLPCLGSYLPIQKITALKALKYEQLIIWLDSDKLKEAWEIEQKAKWMGLSARTIHTELDPKEYSDEEIKTYLV